MVVTTEKRPPTSPQRWWSDLTLWVRAPGEAIEAIGRSPLAIAVVLALGLVIRIAAVQHARFDGEQAGFWETALQIATGDRFPVIGHPVTSSVAGHPGATFFYLMALPQLFTSSPLAGSFFVALLNLLGVWLFFRAIREALDARTAAVFLLLAVASPWTVVYGDSIWPGNLFVPLCGGLAWSLVRVVQRERSRAVFLLVTLLAVSPQIHLSAPQLWVVALVVLGACRPRLAWRWLLAGLVLGIGLYLPYLIHEIRTHFANTRLMFGQVSGGEWSWRGQLGMLLHFFGFATTDVSYLLAQGFWAPFEHVSFWARDGLERTARFYALSGASALLWVYQALSWLCFLAGVLVLGGRWALRAGRWRRLLNQPLALMFLAAVGAIVFFYGLSAKGGFAHYVSMLLPLAFLPPAVLLGSALRRRVLGHLVALYVLGAPIAGSLVLNAYYRADPVLSIPEQEQLLIYVRERAGKRAFSLRFREVRVNFFSVVRLARYRVKLPWRQTSAARDIFLVRRRGKKTALPGGVRHLATRSVGRLEVLHLQRLAPSRWHRRRGAQRPRPRRRKP